MDIYYKFYISSIQANLTPKYHYEKISGLRQIFVKVNP